MDFSENNIIFCARVKISVIYSGEDIYFIVGHGRMISKILSRL